MAAWAGMPAMIGCESSTDADTIDPRRKNSSGRSPLILFVTGSLNCWIANVLDELRHTSVPPARMKVSKAARSSVETPSASGRGRQPRAIGHDDHVNPPRDRRVKISRSKRDVIKAVLFQEPSGPTRRDVPSPRL